MINKSTDGGRSFDKILILDTLNEGAADINMYDSLFGYLIFWPKLYITNDGWKSWEIKDNLNKSSIRNATFINNNEIQYYRITEENVSFSKYNFLTNQVDDLYSFYKNYKQDTSAKNTLLNFCYVNNNIIYATGGRATGFGDTRRDIIYKTIDGGHDWEKVHDSLMATLLHQKELHQHLVYKI